MPSRADDDLPDDDFGHEHELLPRSAGQELPDELLPPGMGLLAISVGNTNTRFVTYHAGHHHEGVSLPNADLVNLTKVLRHAADHLDDSERTAVIVASTNHPFRDELLDSLIPNLDHEVFRLGSDLGVPIKTVLTEAAAERTGQDRLLNALAAFESAKQACVVVSAGTAITVDFVDGEGVFHGGAIVPGLRMWLNSLHNGTAALPAIEPRRPDESAFGADTTQAMLHGAFYGIRGVVRALTERYAEAYEAYPRIVATGGDAKFLFEDDDLIESIDPDLTLRGIAATCRLALSGDAPEA